MIEGSPGFVWIAEACRDGDGQFRAVSLISEGARHVCQSIASRPLKWKGSDNDGEYTAPHLVGKTAILWRVFLIEVLP